MTAGGDDRGARADDTCAREGCSHLRREHWDHASAEWSCGCSGCRCCDCRAWIPEPHCGDRLVPDPLVDLLTDLAEDGCGFVAHHRCDDRKCPERTTYERDWCLSCRASARLAALAVRVPDRDE